MHAAAAFGTGDCHAGVDGDASDPRCLYCLAVGSGTLIDDAGDGNAGLVEIDSGAIGAVVGYAPDGANESLMLM